MAVLGRTVFVGAPSINNSDPGAVYDFVIMSPIHLADGDAVTRDFPSPMPTWDFDDDGVPSSIEDASSGDGDGNSDGQPDAIQENVTTLVTDTGDHITLEVLNPDTQDDPDDLLDTARLVDVHVRDLASWFHPSPPPGVYLGGGMLTFGIEGIAPAQSVDVRITLHSGQHPTHYYKLGPTAQHPMEWYPFDYDGTTGATFDGNTVTLHLVDGQRGDADLLVNGRIIDPGGPAFAWDTPPIIQTKTLATTTGDVDTPATLFGTFSDLTPDDAHVVSIDWGDGQTDQFTLHIGERGFYAEHDYADDSQAYPLVLSVTDLSATDTAFTTIEPLHADAGGPYSIDAGQPLTVDAGQSTGSGDITYAWDLDGDDTADWTAKSSVSEIPWMTLANLGLSTGAHTISVTVSNGVSASAPSMAELSVGDTFVFQPDSDGAPDNYRLMVSGDELQVRNQNPYGAVLSKTLQAPISRVDILGSNDADDFVIDPSGGNPVPAGGVKFEGSEGDDTYRLGGSGEMLDLTVLPAGRLANVERIDLTGTGDNTLTLDAAAVLAITANGTLTVRGDQDDRANLGDGWTHTDSQFVGADYVHIMEHAQATVRLALHPWQNPIFAMDVSGDDVVEPLDVLEVINRINATGSGPLPVPPAPSDLPPAFVDVTGNDHLEPLDVLATINYINEFGSGPIPGAGALGDENSPSLQSSAEGEGQGQALPPLALPIVSPAYQMGGLDASVHIAAISSPEATVCRNTWAPSRPFPPAELSVRTVLFLRMDAQTHEARDKNKTFADGINGTYLPGLEVTLDEIVGDLTAA